MLLEFLHKVLYMNQYIIDSIIREYGISTLLYLEDYYENVARNLLLLNPYFENQFLLRLLFNYPKTFSLPSVMFKEHFNSLMDEKPKTWKQEIRDIFPEKGKVWIDRDVPADNT